jgi:predicted GNAT superfamily acetyltransferase
MSESVSYKIELLTAVGLMRECVEIQRRAWGFSDEDLLPARVLVVCSKIGGQVFGALDSRGKVLGFLNAFPAVREGEVYLHSQMMGVLPDYQNLGIGRQLKLAQREEALKRGISRIEWTFDPFEVRNAYFNIERLGVICRRFYVNTYGTTSSQLQAGLPTDRLVAEWHLDSARVASRLVSLRGFSKRLSESMFLEVPLGMTTIRSEYPEQALQLQLSFRERCLDLLARGYCITQFESSPDSGQARYCLEPYSPSILNS